MNARVYVYVEGSQMKVCTFQTVAFAIKYAAIQRMLGYSALVLY